MNSREVEERLNNMPRSEITKFLGIAYKYTFSRSGKHWASEVSIDPWTTSGKRVDYMQFSLLINIPYPG